MLDTAETPAALDASFAQALKPAAVAATVGPLVRPMTPEQIALVETTLLAARPRLDDMAVAMYRRLFSDNPNLAPLFPGDREAQRAKFTAELDAIVGTIRCHPGFLAAGRDLGARHRGYGVRSSHYRMVGSALLDGLATVLGDRWTPAVEEAWRLAYNLAAETMMAGAAGHR